MAQFYQLSLVTDGADHLLLKTPYSPSFVVTLKAAIPAQDREYIRERRAWRITRDHAEQAIALVKERWGWTMRVTAPPVVTVVEY